MTGENSGTSTTPEAQNVKVSSPTFTTSVMLASRLELNKISQTSGKSRNKFGKHMRLS